VADSLYPSPDDRSVVTGRVVLSDRRPAANFHVILSTQTSTDVFPIAEPTYFVKTDEDGRFRLPGIPPAWEPGTTDPGTYTLYVQPADGSVTDLFATTGVTVHGRITDLGELTYRPTSHGTFVWQIGRSDRTSGEYALASLSAIRPMPREYEKPALIPADLTFTVGESWEPTDWYYAQTNRGTWTVRFPLERTYTGTAYLTVATSMQQGGAPTVAVNGSSSSISGTLPSNNDSTIARQADRSGYPRTAVLSFPASLLTTGDNTITFAHGSATDAGKGPGWDTLVLEIDESATPAVARLSASVKRIATTAHTSTWEVTVTNAGSGTAHDVRVSSLTVGRSGHKPGVTGADPNTFPTPLAALLAPGKKATTRFQVDTAGALRVAVTADGGRTRAVAGPGKG